MVLLKTCLLGREQRENFRGRVITTYAKGIDWYKNLSTIKRLFLVSEIFFLITKSLIREYR